MNDAGRVEKVNLLLVDDRPGNVLSLKGVLERPDYNLVTASSGKEALGLILRQDFALILLDVAMPGMDGFEVASIIKQRERFQAIPIIFITASVLHIEWIFKAYSVGAVDFLQKPLDPHAVRAKVAVFVELYRQKHELKRHAAKLREIERRERELALARLTMESEQRYRHLAEAIPHIVWTADAAGAIGYFNQRWFDVTGLPLEVSAGAGWLEAVHPEDRPRLEDDWQLAMASGQPMQSEFRLRDSLGGDRWHLCRALPESDGDGRVVRWVGTLTDIDEEKQAHEHLQATIRLRDEFLSVASHELRTPLATLQLQLQSALRLFERPAGDALGERLPKKLAGAVTQTHRLARLVDTLLDVSRIARGRLELRLEELDLAEVVREVVERFKDEAARAGCPLEAALSPARGHWDRLRVEQVVTNLLSNSIKYAAGKPIGILVEAREDTALFVVHDEGIGIEPAQLDRIFGRFERAAPARHYGGLGLGLYIVRQIVDAHGGQVTVVSRPGEGSTFTIELPLRPFEAPSLSPAVEAPDAR